MVKLHFLENRKASGYVTWGLPWKKGEIRPEDSFVLENERGEVSPVQSRARAYWPDGSVKWTLHTACAMGTEFVLKKGEENAGGIRVDGQTIYAGRLEVRFAGAVPQVYWKGKVRCIGGELIAKISGTQYKSLAEEIIIEERGPLRAVVKVKGSHNGSLPFILRYYIHYDEPDIRIVHTFLHDLNPYTQRIQSLGLVFEAPISGPIYNRHVRMGGDGGYLKESCVLLNTWRPHLPDEWYARQIQGEELSLEDNAEVSQLMNTMTWWDSWKMVQDSSEHYKILKNTGEAECSDVEGPHGHRAAGILAAAGLSVSLRDFWQKYPSALEVTNMLGDTAQLKVWIWPEDAPSMDLRPYTNRRCFEAYYGQEEPELGMPSGIGQTNEIHLNIYEGPSPMDDQLNKWVLNTQKPALLAAMPAYYHDARAFGTWSLPRYDTPAQVFLEDRLEEQFAFYQREVEQRKWYGLWNYGDFMHSYDKQRHEWRYDLGGWAWQNTELVPTMWLWYMFLRSGREDVFTMAEAMCRHCAEVDLHHMGPFAGLGARHSVKHYGGSAKEARVSMAAHHRFYYYLTGDERTGDIMDEVKDADLTTKSADPLRNFYTMDGSEPYPTHARTGPDWSSYCGNWMTRWERFQDASYRDKMLQGIAGIAAAPYQFVSGSDFGYDPDTGEMFYIGETSTGGSHLALCMGEPQLYFELEDMLEDPAWRRMMSEYGAFYFMTPEEKLAASNERVASKGWGLPMTAAAMAAYAAREQKNARLGRDVWECLFAELLKKPEPQRQVQYVIGKIMEKPTVSTNTTAQWCLNVITSLELAGEYLPEEPIAEPSEKFMKWRS